MLTFAKFLVKQNLKNSELFRNTTDMQSHMQKTERKAKYHLNTNLPNLTFFLSRIFAKLYSITTPCRKILSLNLDVSPDD